MSGWAVGRGRVVVTVVARVVVAAGLAVDAVLHWQLAAGYQLAAPAGVGQGTLFRVEAVVAVVGAVYVLIRGDRWSFVVAAGVAGSALAAVIVYRYVNVPAFGPIPAMYEPVWFAKKTATAVAEAVALLAAGIGLAGANPHRG